MVSDDTDHAVFVTQALLAHPDSPDRFARRLARSFRWWLLSLPAGVGFATLRGIVKLWLGVSPVKSGVTSAGNGPAMRSAPIGAAFPHDRAMRDAYVLASTRITHTDRRAFVGARVVADLVAWSIHSETGRPPGVHEVSRLLVRDGDDPEWKARVGQVCLGLKQRLPVLQFADRLGLTRGVTGYVYDTVPVAAYAWMHHGGDYYGTVRSVLECGGDSDTVGAIAGALAGAAGGEQSIPARWVSGIVDWPRGPALLRILADRLATVAAGDREPRVVQYPVLAALPRNLVFLAIVLVHGFRRLFPPY